MGAGVAVGAGVALGFGAGVALGVGAGVTTVRQERYVRLAVTRRPSVARALIESRSRFQRRHKAIFVSPAWRWCLARRSDSNCYAKMNRGRSIPEVLPMLSSGIYTMTRDGPRYDPLPPKRPRDVNRAHLLGVITDTGVPVS